MKRGNFYRTYLCIIRLHIVNRREILGRMSYESTTGSISGLVEKLKNVEAAIKATRERMERRASGLPPLPPPGLSPVYTSTKQKPQTDQAPCNSIATVTTSSQKPRGVTSVKPIIGLGRGKKFSKQNSFPSAFDDTSTVTSDTGSVSSSDLKSSSSSSSVGVSQNEPKECQPVSNIGGMHEHSDLRLHQESDSHKFSTVSQPQQLNVVSNTISSSVLLNPVPVVANGGMNSATVSLATTSFVAPTADQVAKSFAKLSAKNQAVPFTSVPITLQTIAPSPSVTSQVSPSSRTMTYSSAVASYPARKQPTPLFQPAVPPAQPVSRMPSMPPPLLATPMHPPMIGLGRGNVPWPGGPPPPPPHVWGGNGGPWMQQVPPPAMPIHFDHHHNPFYEIPPLGSSSGLDII